MKRFFILSQALLFSLILYGQALAIPLTAPGNRHNLSKGSGGVMATTETRICVFCHTPHGASPQSPLWNRQDPAQTNFPLYASPTLEIQNIPAAGYSAADQTKYPNGASRMCLSCHDGVSSVGAVISQTSKIIMNYDTLGAYDTATSSKTTIDLSKSHPISFVYSAAVKDAINVAEALPSHGLATYKLPLAGSKTTLDGNERMQCTTCHDPHNDTNNGTTYTLPFWANNVTGVEATDYDNTCNECHVSGDWNSWATPPLSFPNH
ncbi:cytochrome c3 family protein [Geopsychrobacter electrodiphilus]|uniref:cytochrome c3 family protein n=1 Tax=Geopsychrobacter electrodiphilus TaxID=225196 RepID=UPI00039D575B|nr:cytochrome c3 family protein [Geopsychrobacter electrodiphilus]